MRKFLVTCTKIYNSSMEVIAENQEDALNIAQEKLNNDADCVCWQFGEVTADCAADCEDEYQPKYKVGDVLIHNDNPNANFTIVAIRNGKYECSDGVIQPIDELDDIDEFHLVNNQPQPKYKVGDIVKSDNSPADKIVSVNSETYFFESGEQSDITILDDDANFYLVQPPKYNVGDYVGDYHYGYYQITAIKDDKYVFDDGDEVPIAIFDADENHHIETFHREDFQPFDKVLVRDDDHCTWVADFFSHNDKHGYLTSGGLHWEQCVPYNSETAYLLGTTTEYNGKYKTW